MPALGIAMLLQYLNKSKLTPFFFLGWILAQLLGMSTMMITAVGAVIAILLYNQANNPESSLIGGE